jgi:hypothetical protein
LVASLFDMATFTTTAHRARSLRRRGSGREG